MLFAAVTHLVERIKFKLINSKSGKVPDLLSGNTKTAVSIIEQQLILSLKH
jgi:hypothetical protein